jgi:hypothetical protein
MKNQEVIKNYPTSVKLFKEFLQKKVIKSLDNFPDMTEEFKEFIRQKELTDNDVLMYLDESPSVFFPFFDEQKLFINVSNKLLTFKYHIETREGKKQNNEVFLERIAADRAAVIEAFHIFEKKLEEVN